MTTTIYDDLRKCAEETNDSRAKHALLHAVSLIKRLNSDLDKLAAEQSERLLAARAALTQIGEICQRHMPNSSWHLYGEINRIDDIVRETVAAIDGYAPYEIP